MANAYEIFEFLEADNAEANRTVKRRRMQLRKDCDPFNLDEAEFVKRYRLTKNLAYNLCDELRPLMKNPTKSTDLSVETKVLIALSFYATGSYQRPVGSNEGHFVAQQTVSSVIAQVTACLNSLHMRRKYIKFPVNDQERNRIKMEFYNKFRIPGVLGCIDCTQVAIVRPVLHEERFFCRKHYHSLNVQLVCGADMQILSVDASHGGATHDSFIWAIHPLRAHLEDLSNTEDTWFLVALSCEGQRPASLPFTKESFRTIERGFSTVPGRSPTVSDIIIRHYRTNLTSPSSYRIGNVKSLLTDPEFDVKRPTVIYAHGYVELSTDESIITVVSAYLQRLGYNVLLLDWSNIAFGNYVIIAKTLPGAGEHVGKALLKLVKRGLPVKGLHLVGHSMGSHLAAYAARYLKSRGFTVPRLTGLDPAYPGFYPPLAAPPMAASDATFVDAIHTDGGGYGTPTRTAHADFWPNGGQAKQPGCLSATIPLTNEDFCSHWRSWEFWSESLTRDALLARRCQDYDMFLRGQCTEEPVVFMGIRATPDLRGNFYLRTGAKSPYGLNLRGAS